MPSLSQYRSAPLGLPPNTRVSGSNSLTSNSDSDGALTAAGAAAVGLKRSRPLLPEDDDDFEEDDECDDDDDDELVEGSGNDGFSTEGTTLLSDDDIDAGFFSSSNNPGDVNVKSLALSRGARAPIITNTADSGDLAVFPPRQPRRRLGPSTLSTLSTLVDAHGGLAKVDAPLSPFLDCLEGGSGTGTDLDMDTSVTRSLSHAGNTSHRDGDSGAVNAGLNGAGAGAGSAWWPGAPALPSHTLTHGHGHGQGPSSAKALATRGSGNAFALSNSFSNKDTTDLDLLLFSRGDNIASQVRRITETHINEQR